MIIKYLFYKNIIYKLIIKYTNKNNIILIFIFI